MSSSQNQQSGGNNSTNKKGGSGSSGSGNGSTVNTPAQTPNSNNIPNGQAITHSTPPPNNNAPKYGTLVPNRIFVGGISANTTEGELLQLFSNYGTVKAAKIIQDRAGVSKGYGFITFESEDDAKRLQREADNIVLRERKLNIAPAIKKQPFSRTFDASSPPAVAAGNPQYYFQPGATMPFFQGGVAYYPQPPAPPTDATAAQPTAATVYQPAPPVYPAQSAPPQTATYPSVMFPQPIYVPQQYPMHVPYPQYEYYNYPPNGAPPQFVMGTNGNQGTTAQHQQPGGGGPPLVQPPGSPPRQQQHHASGYGGQQQQQQQQQLPPAYNSADVYFNFPMYGPMEGPAVYADGSLDLANGNPYAEESYFLVDGIPSAIQDIDTITATPPPPTTATVTIAASHSPASFNVGSSQQLPPPPPPSSSVLSQMQENNSTVTDTTRQSTTPVVSLLSLDQRHEKDVTAMQGGRRRKSAPPPSQPPQQQQQQQQNVNYVNGFISPYTNYMPPVEYEYQSYYNNNKKMTNGWSKKKQQQHNKSYESSSSVRSDSNSSASVVDENRNEEKNANAHRTNVISPPPAPYSPIVNHQNYGKFGRGRGHTSFRQRKFFPSRTDEQITSFDGMNVVGSQQHFAPPSRNTVRSNYGGGGGGGGGGARRLVRRNTSSSTPLSEIGAGDAPLPGVEVSDACKKLDSLKL